MSHPIDGRRRRSSGQGSASKTLKNMSNGPATLRVDAPTFKPASPPRTNPWTNFAPRSSSEPLLSDASDPPLPSQVKDGRNDENAEEISGPRLDAELVPELGSANRGVSTQSPKHESTELAHGMSTPLGSSSWADEIMEPQPQVYSDNKDSHNEVPGRATSSTNPWFSSNNPFLRKVKARSDPLEAHSSDPPLPPISETQSTADRPEKGPPSSTSKSTVIGSPLKNEVSVAEDETVPEQSMQAVPPVAGETEIPQVASPTKNSRPSSRDSTHSLTSADTARRTARSISTGSEDSRRALVAAALRGDEQ